MSARSSTGMLLRIGLRSLFAHKVKSLIVGVILAFGTFLLAVLMTLFTNVRASMERSVTGSLIGHLQVMSDKAKDDLAFFGPAASAAQDLGVISHYVKTRDALLKIPNVTGVVPMGRDVAQIISGNLVDEQLDALRAAVRAGDTVKIHKLGARIRQIAALLKEEYTNKLKVTAKKDEVRQQLSVLDRVLSDSFWADLEKNPAACTLPADPGHSAQGCLDFLDTRLAQLQSDSAMMFLAYLGTDLDLFAQKFDKFRIVDGTMVPKGHRGMLLSKNFYEKMAKNPVAREFDDISDGIHKDGNRITAGKGWHEEADPKLSEEAKRLGRQTKRLLFDLGPDESVAVQADLKKLYGTPSDLPGLLTKLLTVNQDNFDAHKATFYKVIAPRIKLYSIRIGDTVTLQAYSQSGYSRAANSKVYGTFKFDGLDGSLVASAYSLVDLMTFRDLYGLMTPERKKEIAELRKAVGVKELGKGDDTEAALFGSGATAGSVAQAPVGAITMDPIAPSEQARRKEADVDTFTQSDIDNGVVIHAAVILKDPGKIEETQAAIEQVSKKDGLGLKVIDWVQAAGIIGQLILVIRWVLVVFFGAIFIVILAVINNAMLMATKDRVVEIGTMRAIGAQRNFILAMILLETVVLWAAAAFIGLSASSSLIHWLGLKGIPAGTQPIMIVLFGGPRLYPYMTPVSVLFSLACIGVVSLIATVYPAWSAARVPPIVAMTRRE